jgi:putative pyruvate formate lyase activating enzyme
MGKKVTKKLVDELYGLLSPCRICPRACKAKRLDGESGNCSAGIKVKISSFHQHFGEEPPLVGRHGSGTIFFTNCNLHCVFCQNYQISQLGMGREATLEELGEMMLKLQNLGCHNINFVTPTPWVPQIVKALALAQDKGLNIPIVYNCGGYESLETLKLLEGVIDIYMPDIKYADNEHAEKYSIVPDYWDIVRPAPNDIAGSRTCFEFVSQHLSVHTVVNVMAQYYPTYKASQVPDIDRRITTKEYRHALTELERCGLDEGFRQTIDTIFRVNVPEWTDDLS